MKRTKPQYIILAIIGVAVAAVALPQMFAEQPGTRATEGSQITETINVVDTDAEVVVQLRLTEGGDAVHEASHVFEALAPIPGVGRATFDTESLQVTVSYDSAAIDPDVIEQQLAIAGYAVPTEE